MKKNVHPKYQKVLFVDSASGHKFICGSTLEPEATEVFEGVEYPVSYLSISSSSHPFFTGSKQLVDSEGRVEKFKKRFERKKEEKKEDQSQEESAAKAGKTVKAKKK
jgi:large subunit ribosomal protein L31